MIDGAAIGHDGAKSFAEAFAVSGFAVDLNIGDEAEHGSAPVGPAPGVRVVQPQVVGCGLAFVHVVHHVAPNLLRGQLAGFNACNGLNVGGETLFYPVLIAGH